MRLPGTLAVAALCVALYLRTPALGSHSVILMSDIHHDPLYGTAMGYVCTQNSSPIWGMFGCDSPPQLTARSLDDASAQNTSLLLYSGDWQRHHYLESALEPSAVFEELSELFRRLQVDGSLGVTAFSAALGNNDVVPDYFFSWINEGSEKELSFRVEAMRAAGLLSDAEAAVMRKCGYYAHGTPYVHVIVLHTLLWTYALKPSLPSNVSDPCEQFTFLRSQLEKTRADGKRAVIVGHIPPGLNTYYVLSRGFQSGAEDMFWKEVYEVTYDSIIYEYKDLIALQLFGHTHRFKLLTMPRNGALGIVAPAISPIFSNYPSYLLANFSNAWSLEDVRIRYTSGGGVFHSGLSAKEALGLTTSLQSVTDVRAAITHLATDDTAWERFLTMFCGGEKRLQVFPRADCDKQCRYVLVCSMLENNYSDIQRCVADYNALPGPSRITRTSSVMIAVIVLFSLVVIAADVMLLLMSRSRQTALSWSNLKSAGWWKALVRRPQERVITEESHEMQEVTGQC
ncbi:hypothetical protein LSCM1_02389 [Leishmania martiniquensis]|uniref:Calcineurin-like phosphoesterase domain-containing protein n=1 Tax=Leishmania martiniquensis TaxID=1580590 RepID=A0A836K9M7_9TRYP|nr:hypothetical protein LSCM1_02389 [Leishmania martiniquensis]